jgi:hypothetical protein
MRSLTLPATALAAIALASLCGVPASVPAMAQSGTLTPQGVPPGTNVETGARPGNQIGTGMSMPMSTRASNLGPADTRSPVAPNLPAPPLGENSPPSAYLRAAQGALSAGRTGEAQQALEMAQTRMLDRSVPMGQTNRPSDNPVVGQISQALRALSVGDRATAAQMTQTALNTASAHWY